MTKTVKDQLSRIRQKGRRIAHTLIRASRNPWRTSIDVFRAGGLGDVLMCTPALRALKQANPNCKINFYTDFPGLVRGLWYLDKVDHADHRPATAIHLHYEDVKFPKNHLAKLMGQEIGVRVDDVRPDCNVQRELVEKFRNEWREFPRPHILVQRRASHWTPNKNWPEEYWQGLIRSLSKSASIIEIGEADPGRPGLEDSGRYIDLRGKTNIDALIACVAAADILVAPVSGPSHIAAAVGTPAVVIVGGYELAANATYPGNKVFYTAIGCSPCWLRTPCPIDRECLRQILPEAVEQAVRGLLAEAPRQAV
jgi:ADP-heptose:LPS heptosyltransferase